MHNAPQLFPVPFHGDTVVLVGQDNEPYVAMKPIVTNMGMDWKSQHSKLAERFASTMVEITTVAEDGKLRAMACLPLKKLPAWFYSISPNKVASELREKIIRYQEECDDALWSYWTQGVAQGTGPAANANKQIALSRHRLALLKELHRTRNRALRCAIHEQLALVSQTLGLTTPELETVGRSEPSMSDVLAAFWEGTAQLDSAGEVWNHAHPDSGKIYLNLPELRNLFKKHQINLPIDSNITRTIEASLNPLFIKSGCFSSSLKRKKMRGLIFRKTHHSGNER